MKETTKRWLGKDLAKLTIHFLHQWSGLLLPTEAQVCQLLHLQLLQPLPAWWSSCKNSTVQDVATFCSQALFISGGTMDCYTQMRLCPYKVLWFVQLANLHPAICGFAQIQNWGMANDNCIRFTRGRASFYCACRQRKRVVNILTKGCNKMRDQQKYQTMVNHWCMMSWQWSLTRRDETTRYRLKLAAKLHQLSHHIDLIFMKHLGQAYSP